MVGLVVVNAHVVDEPVRSIANNHEGWLRAAAVRGALLIQFQPGGDLGGLRVGLSTLRVAPNGRRNRERQSQRRRSPMQSGPHSREELWQTASTLA